jgi:AcrR family transcriptional regulator
VAVAFDEARADPLGSVLSVALELFEGYGFDRVSVARIRGAAGISARRLNAFYPSKDELALAVLERAELLWWASIQAELATAEPDLRSQVAAILHAARRPDGSRQHALLFARARLEYADQSDPVMGACDAQRLRFRRGLVHTTTEFGGTPQLAEAILLRLDGLLMQSILDGEVPSFAEIERAADELVSGVEASRASRLQPDAESSARAG